MNRELKEAMDKVNELRSSRVAKRAELVEQRKLITAEIEQIDAELGKTKRVKATPTTENSEAVTQSVTDAVVGKPNITLDEVVTAVSQPKAVVRTILNTLVGNNKIVQTSKRPLRYEAAAQA